jgi:cyclopropane-fatty-acyl-phospholipid synthase
MAAANESFRREGVRGLIALVPYLANDQHYEVPAKFYQEVLDPHLKCSCAFWDKGTQTLVAADDARNGDAHLRAHR